jgi:glycerol-3-phosphate dehydrogenase
MGIDVGDGTTENVSGALPFRNPKTQKIDGNISRQSGVNVLPDYDVIVIGGGINGTAIALDAATREAEAGEKPQPGKGLKVLLLEKDDFGGATSAYNSRLIHGGLRYLEYGEISLVLESLQERERLLRNAPHLVRPLPSLMPVMAYHQHGLLLLELGLTLYDWLSSPLWQGRLRRNMPRHRFLSKDAFLREMPHVETRNLKGGFFYYDAQVTLPERLCLENAVAAQETGNATVLNHAEVTEILTQTSGEGCLEAIGVSFLDKLSGERYTVKGKVLINASGPWVDRLLGSVTGACSAGKKPSRRIGGVEGAHIIVQSFPGAPETAVYFEAKGLQDPDDKGPRMIFILPWLSGHYLIGTTERRFDPEHSPDEATANASEIDYLLREVNGLIPVAGLKKEQVMASYSGVRPLPYEPGKNAHQVTRRHIIEDHAQSSDCQIARLVSVIGGKLTTERSLAQDVVSQAIRRYNLHFADGSRPGPSRTGDYPLPGGEDLSEELVRQARDKKPEAYKRIAADLKENIRLWAYKVCHVDSLMRQSDLSRETIEYLMGLYGSRCRQVLELITEDRSLEEPLSDTAPDIGAQVVYAVRQEMAVNVMDVMSRRLCLRFQDDLGVGAVQRVARLMGKELQWSAERVEAEIDTYKLWAQMVGCAIEPEWQSQSKC